MGTSDRLSCSPPGKTACFQHHGMREARLLDVPQLQLALVFGRILMRFVPGTVLPGLTLRFDRSQIGRRLNIKSHSCG